MEYAAILLSTACVFGFFMAWGIVTNDVANATGPMQAPPLPSFYKQY